MLHQSGRRNKVRVAILSKSHPGIGHLIRLRLIIMDTQVCIALDCCKDFRNLLKSKLNEIEEKEKTHSVHSRQNAYSGGSV